MFHKLRVLLSAAVLTAVVAVATPSVAETVQGTWVRYRFNDTGLVNGGHISGIDGFGVDYRAGIVFTIPSGETIAAAQLTIAARNVTGGPNDLGVYPVTISGSTVLTGGFQSGVYADLGDGVVIGTATAVTTGQTLTITLSPAAVAAINAAQGGTYSVGLINQTITPATVDNIFESSVGTDQRDLILTRVAPVPTLSEWAMILFGTLLAGGAALYVQRRRFAT